MNVSKCCLRMYPARPQLFSGVNRVGRRIHMLLEGIDPQVDWPRNCRRDNLTGGSVVLDLKMYFPIPVSDGIEFTFAIVEELVSRRLLALADEVRKLVVTVEVYMEALSPWLMTFP